MMESAKSMSAAANEDNKSNVLQTDFDGNDGNVETETKSISSLKSIGSAQDR